jgi:hypothetical protein
LTVFQDPRRKQSASPGSGFAIVFGAPILIFIGLAPQ